LNERCVEIPIIKGILCDYQSKKILEIGNVLSKYFSFEHDIVDRYEIKGNVINQDVVDFKSTSKYDLIVSISTLEHVGWDERPRDDTKILCAVANLKNLVRPQGGLIVVTLPLGYNTALDELIKSGRLKFTNQYYLKRISKGNEWRESAWKDVQHANYGKPYPNVNAVLIGQIET
jgi:SAM-dependent methyltransferase